jgi:hypothetical protein
LGSATISTAEAAMFSNILLFPKVEARALYTLMFKSASLFNYFNVRIRGPT